MLFCIQNLFTKSTAFYTRPQDGFIETGSGGGIGWGLSDTIENAEIRSEIIVDDRVYHTIKEVKNGLGPAPLKTDKGWLQLAHGVRNTAAGLRYVLYLFLTDLKDPSKVIARPQGYFLAPKAWSVSAMSRTSSSATAGYCATRVK